MGLGDMGARIDNLFRTPDFQNQAGAYVSSDVSGTEQSATLGYAGHPLHLPDTDMTVPVVEKSGRIVRLLDKRNPIFVQLSDGTSAYFTYDEYRRIQGKPAPGKVMHISFQRHLEDESDMPSQIIRVRVD